MTFQFLLSMTEAPRSEAQETFVKVPRPAKIENIPKDTVTALYDLDGTLTEPGSELLIETFLRDVAIGRTKVRDELKERFDQWHAARRAGNPDYEQFLKDVGLLWARMLHADDSGKRITRPQVVEEAGEWYKKVGNRDLQPYAGDIMGIMREKKLEPVLVTGAPYEIACWYAADLGINHVFAMDAELDSELRYTTKMRYPANTGIGANKAGVCSKLIEARIPVGLAMGDTPSDIVLHDTAINKEHKRDIYGGAFLINPRAESYKIVRATRRKNIHSGRLRVIDQGDTREWISEQVRNMVDSVLQRNRMKDGQDLVRSA